jgi:hypothetical protein
LATSAQEQRADAPAVLQADKRKSEESSSSTKKLQVLGAAEKAADAARARDQRAEVARQKEQQKNDALEERKQKRVTAVKTRQAAENKKASDKVEAEVQKEVAKANKALADFEALAKVRAAAAQFDADALAQGRGPKPKAKPRKSVAEKRKEMDNKGQAGAGQPSRPRIEDRPPDATDPDPPAPPKRPRAKAAAKPRRPKMSAATIAPEGPGDPSIVGGQKQVYEERGLFPAMPAVVPEAPVPVRRPKRSALNMMSAQQMAALVQSTLAAPATTNPTKSAKPKAVPSSAPASLIKMIQDAATLPKGMGGSAVPQQRAARRKTAK